MSLFGKLFKGSKKETNAMATVIVKKSAMENEPWKVVQAIVDFANAQMQEGAYRHDELPAEIMQTYHADYYLAQVNNGGHSQFVHNSLNTKFVTWPNALAGLEKMGAKAQAETLRKMMDWVEANPDESKAQTGFDGGRADTLDQLDTDFFTAQKTNPITEKAAVWVKSWPNLRIVEDDKYPTILTENAHLNPKREDRLISRAILNNHFWFTDRLRVSIGLAVTSGENIEALLGIGGGSTMQVEGAPETVWTIATNKGKRFAVVVDAYARMYEHIEHSPPPKIDYDDPKGSFDAYQASNYIPPEVGARLTEVSGGVIDELIERANEVHAGAAIDLMLRKAGLDANAVQITPVPPVPREGDKPIVSALLVCGQAAYNARIFDKGAVLTKIGDSTSIATVPTIEIDAHWKRTET